MNRYLGMALMTCLLLTSCGDDDAIGPGEGGGPNNGLAGTWYLTNVNGTLSGINEDVSRGEVAWTFDEGSSLVTVVNNLEDFELLWLLESGIYSYEITTTNDVETIAVDDINLGNLSIFDGVLNMDQRAVDGVQMLFER